MAKYGPDRSDYEDFQKQLAEQPSDKNLTSGISTGLALLLAIPAVVVAIWVLFRLLIQ